LPSRRSFSEGGPSLFLGGGGSLNSHTADTPQKAIGRFNPSNGRFVGRLKTAKTFDFTEGWTVGRLKRYPYHIALTLTLEPINMHVEGDEPIGKCAGLGLDDSGFLK